MQATLHDRYGPDASDQPFRTGYNRGQHYLSYVSEKHQSEDQQHTSSEPKQSKQAA
jgi:hypothetical protein